MKVSVLDKQAFVDIGNGYLLCIGTQTEIERATIEEIGDKIMEALAYSLYRKIDKSRKFTRH